jgi:hypothetical protein
MLEEDDIVRNVVKINELINDVLRGYGRSGHKSYENICGRWRRNLIEGLRKYELFLGKRR